MEGLRYLSKILRWDIPTNEEEFVNNHHYNEGKNEKWNVEI